MQQMAEVLSNNWAGKTKAVAIWKRGKKQRMRSRKIKRLPKKQLSQ